jgi:hypothetical protein
MTIPLANGGGACNRTPVALALLAAGCNRTPGAPARCSPATGPLLATVTILTNDPVAGLRADPVASG